MEIKGRTLQEDRGERREVDGWKLCKVGGCERWEIELEDIEVEIKVEPELEAKTELEAEVEVETEMEAGVKVEIQVEAEVEMEIEVEVEVEVEIELEVEVEVEIEVCMLQGMESKWSDIDDCRLCDEEGREWLDLEEHGESGG